MNELLVLSNPRRRRRKGAKSAKRRGKRRMTAAQRRYFGPRRSRRASPVVALSNPRKRRYRRSMKTRMRRASRRAQRGFALLAANTGSLSRPFSMVGPALTGAIGAVAVHSVLSRLPLPALLMTGKARYLTQGAAAIGLGMIAARVPGIGSGVAAKMAEGALTVTLNDAIKEFAADAGFSLGGMGYYLPGRQSASPSASGNPARIAGMAKYMTGPGARPAQMGNLRGNLRAINTFVR